MTTSADYAMRGRRIQSPRLNRLWIVVIHVLFLGLWYLSDFTGRWGEPPAPDDRIGLLGATLITAALGLCGALASAVGWYPCVEIREKSLVVRNPLRDTIVPWSVIKRVDDESTWVRLQTSSGWIRCFGVERTLADQIMTSSRPTNTSEEIESLAASGDGPDAPGSDLQRRWRRPTGWEITTSTIWVLLTLFTLLAYKP